MKFLKLPIVKRGPDHWHNASSDVNIGNRISVINGYQRTTTHRRERNINVNHLAPCNRFSALQLYYIGWMIARYAGYWLDDSDRVDSLLLIEAIDQGARVVGSVQDIVRDIID